MHTHPWTLTPTRTQTHTHAHTQASTHIYCTQHCACPQTKKKKPSGWCEHADKRFIPWGPCAICAVHVYLYLSMCYLCNFIYVCVCLSGTFSSSHGFASVQKSKMCILDAQFFLSSPIASFSAVGLRLFAITVHTRVSVIVSPGSSCHEHRASAPLSNLQQQQ